MMRMLFPPGNPDFANSVYDIGANPNPGNTAYQAACGPFGFTRLFSSIVGGLETALGDLAEATFSPKAFRLLNTTFGADGATQAAA